MYEWFRTTEGRLAVRRATTLELPVRPPFEDALTVSRSHAYPFRRYSNSSELAGARFDAVYDYISACGQWHAEIDGQKLSCEFGDREMLTLNCPLGAAYLLESQRDIILRLLGGEGGPQRVRFVRNHDYNEIRRKLWDEHIRKVGS